MENEIVIRKASIKDAEGVFQLLNFWYNNYFNVDKSKGHMYSDVTWSIKDIERTINESVITVAANGEKIVSFYFINTFLEIGNVAKRIEILNPMIKEGKLPKGRYAFSLAAATDDNYLGKGLNRSTLNLLRELVKDEYDYFTGVMSYDNIPTQKSSIKMGWRHFGDIGIGLLAVIGTTEEKNEILDKHLNQKQ